METNWEKKLRIEELLAEIEAGNFGAFAGQNHSVSYNVEGEGLELGSVWVARAFQLPVERDDARQLISEMNTYRLEHCLER